MGDKFDQSMRKLVFLGLIAYPLTVASKPAGRVATVILWVIYVGILWGILHLVLRGVKLLYLFARQCLTGTVAEEPQTQPVQYQCVETLEMKLKVPHWSDREPWITPARQLIGVDYAAGYREKHLLESIHAFKARQIMTCNLAVEEEVSTLATLVAELPDPIRVCAFAHELFGAVKLMSSSDLLAPLMPIHDRAVRLYNDDRYTSALISWVMAQNSPASLSNLLYRHVSKAGYDACGSGMPETKRVTMINWFYHIRDHRLL